MSAPGRAFTFAGLPGVALMQEEFGMPNYTINTNEASVAIEITGVEGRQAELLEAFGECQQGQCSCPTNEYEKVDAMDLEPAEDRIAITLRAKPGVRFDEAEITACLDYTVGKGDT